MRLSTLLESIYSLDPSFDREILGLAQDSRQIQAGSLFLACRGRTFDGRLYIEEALAKGASAVLADADQNTPGLEWRDGIPILTVPNLSSLLFELAAHFFNYPASASRIIGVTGTNGKTSCSHYIAQALEHLGHTCGLIGTLGSGFPGALKETLMTTPDTVTLQKIFSELSTQQAQYVAMEVSSHSLDQNRIEGLDFEVGIFTNLSQDHLDYHGTMAAYGAAKKRFFTDYPLRQAIINADDAFGRELLASLASDKLLAYSTKGRVAQFPSVFVEEAYFDHTAIHAQIFTPWGEGSLSLPLMGEFNLSNILAVLAALGSLGLPLAETLSCLSRIKSVPGRMQVFGGANQPWVVVDYAHTPDALEKALRTLRQHCEGKLYCLFGCGGNRDKGKRPLMGAAAERYADFIMLTNDNPRYEDPDLIISDILKGVNRPEQILIQNDRFKAIQDIIQCASPGDYVLIAGKGAESYQQIGDEKSPFSDARSVEEVLKILSS